VAPVGEPHGLSLFRGEDIGHGRRPLHLQICELLFECRHLVDEVGDLGVISRVGEQRAM